MKGTEDPPVHLALALRRADGDPELLEELVKTFQDDLPARMDRLRAALEHGDLAEVTRSAHSLRGSLGVLGADHSRILAEELEVLAAAKRGDEVASAGLAFEREMARVSAFFSSVDLKDQAWRAGQ